MSNNRNGKIELLRFVFAVCIVLHHLTYPGLEFAGGFISVEFFFMLTGYYLAKKITRDVDVTKNVSETIPATMDASKNEVLHRLKKLMPYFAISWIFGLLVILGAGNGFGESRFAVLKSIIFASYDFLFGQCLGIPSLVVSGVLWYLSAMFVSIIIIYPIARRHYKIYVYYAPLLALFSMGYLFRNFGSLNIPDTTFAAGLFNTGILRGISMISLGMWIYDVSVKLNSGKHKINRVLISVFEIILYIVIVCIMNVRSANNTYLDLLSVCLILLALVISTSDIGIINSSCFNNKIYTFLGNLSMVLFLNHFYWIHNINGIFTRLKITGIEDSKMKILSVIFAFITSIVVILLIDILKKIKSHYKKAQIEV
jgi:peptidoglycan/LPS O-acetylase OafA/YrhL